MKKEILKLVIIFSVLPTIILAQGSLTPPSELWGPSGVVQKLVGALLGIVFILGVIFLIMGGVMYITAGGDAAKVDQAKNVLLYSVIGIGVAVIAWALMRFVMQYLTGWAP